MEKARQNSTGMISSVSSPFTTLLLSFIPFVPVISVVFLCRHFKLKTIKVSACITLLS
jgi:hypothetical protein